MMNFERFDDVNHLPLRVFNRVIYLTNLVADYGQEVAKSYLETFNKGEQAQITMLGMYIKDKGRDTVRKEVTNGLEIVDAQEV